MWAGLLTAIVNGVLIPLFSKLIVSLFEYFNNRKEESERNEKTDAAVQKYKEASAAKDKQAKKDAFLELVRPRNG